MIDPKNFHGRGQVAVLRTRPETVLDDYYRLMQLCGYDKNLPRAHDTILNLNLTWQVWFPASSTAPWQLDAVIRALLRDGFSRERICPAYNRASFTRESIGARNNRHALILEHYGIRDLYANGMSVEWVDFQPRQPLAVLDKIFPDGIFVPKAFLEKNIVHLPTMKTDAVTLINGAMKNALGGLMDDQIYRTQINLHDALVDLLQIQQELHSGIFCVMDGTFAGEGAGPRALRPFVKNTILASSDPVALDSVAAKIMGIDPLRIRFIRHAHERGLGVGDPREIQILGDARIAQENWHFEHDRDTLASAAQKQLVQRARPLLDSPFASAGSAFANAFYNVYWYPMIGAKRAEMMLNTAWGQKFLQYSEGLPFNPGASDKTRFAAIALLSAAAVAALGIGMRSSLRRSS